MGGKQAKVAISAYMEKLGDQRSLGWEHWMRAQTFRIPRIKLTWGASSVGRSGKEVGYYTKIRFLISALNSGGGAETCAPFFSFTASFYWTLFRSSRMQPLQAANNGADQPSDGTRIRFMKSVFCADLALVGAVNIDGDMAPSDHAVPHCASASQQPASATRFEFQYRHVYCHRKGRQAPLVLFTILIPPVATSPHLQSILDPLSSTAACAQPPSQQRDTMSAG